MLLPPCLVFVPTSDVLALALPAVDGLRFFSGLRLPDVVRPFPRIPFAKVLVADMVLEAAKPDMLLFPCPLPCHVPDYPLIAGIATFGVACAKSHPSAGTVGNGNPKTPPVDRTDCAKASANTVLNP